uniref:Reverse transcriptase domain-containing protein n=1 Tax=Strongyloides papillosus TaxID=174720 RepID=A0A0N5BDD3_STREA
MFNPTFSDHKLLLGSIKNKVSKCIKLNKKKFYLQKKWRPEHEDIIEQLAASSFKEWKKCADSQEFDIDKDYVNFTKIILKIHRKAMEMTPKISYYSSKTLDMFASRKQLINELKLERKSNNSVKDISVLLLELSILKKSLRIQTSLDLETHRNKVIMNALEKRQSIKKARKQLMTRREVYEISTNDGISFYNKLYNMNDNDAKMAKAALSNFKYLDNNKDEVLPFLEDEVSRTLLSMGRFKMVGPDKMCSDVLRFCGRILIQILTDRFNFYVKNCLTPKEWKKSIILLLHKKGSKSDISNFRPLSLTSHVYKIFSSLILSRMQNRLQKEIGPYQYGFRKNRSTCDAILVVENILAKAYEYQWEIGVAFLDYTKAFDTIIPQK